MSPLFISIAEGSIDLSLPPSKNIADWPKLKNLNVMVIFFMVDWPVGLGVRDPDC